MTYAFTKWKEQTTTSLSERHLGHYKALTVYDGKDKNEELKAFSLEILSAYNVIIHAALVLGIPLHRWEQSIVLMIKKVKKQSSNQSFRCDQHLRSRLQSTLEILLAPQNDSIRRKK